MAGKGGRGERRERLYERSLQSPLLCGPLLGLCAIWTRAQRPVAVRVPVPSESEVSASARERK